MKTQTSSSITLSWEVPDGPNPQNYIYWVQWPGDADKNETRNTTMTSYTVEGLKSASSYEFSVWAEKDRIPGSESTLEGSTGQKHPVLFPLFCIEGVGGRRWLRSYRRRCQQRGAHLSLGLIAPDLHLVNLWGH